MNKMKKIVINGRFIGQRTTGVQRYAREIISELDRLIQSGEVIMAIPPEITDVPQYDHIEVVKVGRLHNHLWEHISFPMFILKHCGISLNLCNVAPLPTPGIVCIHDVKVRATPQYFSKKFLMWYNLLFSNAVKRAKSIITVSEFSKEEIIKYYHVSMEKIHVISNAWQHYARIGYDENALDKYGLEKCKYFFAMSSLEPNKNFRWIAEVAKRNMNYVFAIAGSINEKVFADGLDFECPNNMKLLGYVSDEEAKTLMRECNAFIFPSFYEGFGIPPLEAISAGAKQVVVSDTAVMHEIFGSSVVYIDPQNPEIDITDIALSNISVDSYILEKYAWKKSAKQLYELLKGI